MRIPPKLRPGDQVSVIAPAGYIPSGSLDSGISQLQSWGLQVVVGKHVYEGEGFFSASDQHRLDDFQRALDDPSIRAIFMARGGYGLGRILDRLDFEHFEHDPKWVVGFSDITLLHFHLHDLGVASIHGPMVKQMDAQVEEECLKRLKEFLFNSPTGKYEVASNTFNLNGQTEGLVIGGNLTLVANNIGTSSDTDFKGKILFLEEVNEFMYAIDRHFNHLERAGKLQDLAGVILGEFLDVKETTPTYHQSINQLISGYLSRFDYPVLFDFPAGHGKANMPLPLSIRCKLTVNPAGGVVEFLT